MLLQHWLLLLLLLGCTSQMGISSEKQFLDEIGLNYASHNPAQDIDWQQYSDRDFNFSVSIPKNWITSKTTLGKLGDVFIGFGDKNSISGGMIWGITVHNKIKSKDQFDKLINQIGIQFDDRSVTSDTINVRSGIATLVRVTTAKNPAWISETVFIETSTKIYQISNGAIRDPNFERFYKSFTLNTVE